MNRRSVAVTAVLSCVALTPLYAQECKDCARRDLVLFDNEVKIPRPTSDKDIIKYRDYYVISAGVRNYLLNRDPSRDCITFRDGGFLTAGENPQRNLKVGLEHANTPPPGEVAGGFDYIVYGTISGGEKPTLTLKVETAQTRESVTSVVIDLPKGFEPIQLGRDAAASIGPIYTTIMSFEKKKRDRGEPYAIRPKLTLRPAKATLNANETTTIDVSMQDCDGVFLAKRPVTLTASGGTLANASVTTDGQGKAVVEFTAGSRATTASISAQFDFRKPTLDHSSTDGAQASIAVVRSLTLPEKFVMTFTETLHTKDRRSQFESVRSI
jgi:hypothetical protein